MTRTLKVLKAIVITGAASGYLMQTCTTAGHGFSVLPNVGQALIPTSLLNVFGI